MLNTGRTLSQDPRRVQHMIHIRRKVSKKEYIDLDGARTNKWSTDWANYEPRIPKVQGVQELELSNTDELIDFIDWTHFSKHGC